MSDQVMTETSINLPYRLAEHRRWLADSSTGTRADLTGANLTGADLTGANLTRADLTGANLTRADLTGANLTRADLTRADLTGANLTWADLTRADLNGANLTGANLTWADLTRADLTWADLTRADLTRADLTGANLTGADLTRADLTGANLIHGGQRSDGYTFFLVREKTRAMVSAGCRYFTPIEGRAHWTSTRADTRLGNESLAMIDHLERMAKIAGWLTDDGDFVPRKD
jgi:uncharacterized protein YjbI with pentapeptide repeats